MKRTALRASILAATLMILAGADALAVPVGKDVVISVPVKLDILATTSLEIVDQFDYAAASPNTTADSTDVGTVNFFGLTPSASQYVIGSTAGTYTIKFRISTNEGTWNLQTRGLDNFVDVTLGKTIPLGQLKWALNDSGTFNPFTTTFANVTPNGGNQAPTDYTIDYGMTINYADQPGTGYNTTIEFKVF